MWIRLILLLFVWLPVYGKSNIDTLKLALKKIHIPGYNKAFNPSILKNDKGFLLVFRNCPKPHNLWESYIGIVQLDENFKPISIPEILNIKLPITDVSRVEDARLITYQGNIYIVFNGCIDKIVPTVHNRRDIYFCQLVFENGHYRPSKPLKLIYPEKYNSQRVQKNWVPFIWNDQLLFAYYLNPHEILLPDLQTGQCSLLCESSFFLDWKWGELRGGTPGVIVDGEYLAFFHSSIWVGSALHYFIGAYTFSTEPPFQITKITLEPIVDPRFYTRAADDWRLLFPVGLYVIEDEIYMSYGKDDSEIWIAKMKKKNLMAQLMPIEN